MSFLTTFSDEASKTYKDAARTATTGPINLLSAPASIGSVSLNLNDRVLVKDQANAEENGIYVFKGAGSPMVRSTDANSDREVLPNMLISVSEGDYEDKIFELITNGPISLGVTPLSFGLAILPIDLTTDVVGVLPVANGGTNRASWTEGRVVFAGASGSALAEDSELNWDNSNKRLGIGTASPNAKVQINNSGTQVGLSVYSTSTNNALQFFNEGSTSYTAAFYNSADSAQTGASIGGYFSRGTLSARAQSLANDVLLSLTGSGYTGSAFAPSVSGGIVVAADQNTTAGGFGGQVSIVTTPNDTLGLPLPRLTVKNDGNVGIGTTTPADKLHVVGAMPLIISNSTTDNANKSGRLTTTHYSVSEEPLALIGGSAFQTTNSVLIGGGYTSVNAATDIQFYTAANTTTTTGSERMRIDSAGRVLIGTTVPSDSFTRFQLAANASPGMFIDGYEDSGNGPGIYARKARGVQSAPTSTQVNDVLLGLSGRLYGTTGFTNTSRASILFRAAENCTDIAQGTYITFRTTAIGTTTMLDRMRINDNGDVGIGTATPTQKLEVAGNTKTEGLLLQSRHNLTGAVTVLSNDYYVGCNSSGGAVTVALQSAATAKQGRKLVIKAESSLANVTINAAAGETIDGSASHVLNVSYESVTLVCNGANAWFIV